MIEFLRGILRDVSDCHSQSRIGLGLNSSTDWTGFSTNFTDRIGSICGLDFQETLRIGLDPSVDWIFRKLYGSDWTHLWIGFSGNFTDRIGPICGLDFQETLRIRLEPSVDWIFRKLYGSDLVGWLWPRVLISISLQHSWCRFFPVVNVQLSRLLPQLKVSIRILSGHIVSQFDFTPDIYGLDLIGC